MKLPSWSIFLACFFQLLEITGNTNQKFILFVYNIIVRPRCSVINICFHFIAYTGLSLQKLPIFFIRFCVYIELDQSTIVYRYHIVEPKLAKLTVVQSKNMLS